MNNELMKALNLIRYDEDREEPDNYRVCGWLELDNGWFAFTDKEMYEGVARLFGVEL